MTGVPRRSARALVINDDRVLVIHRRRAGRVYATLPGGGVEADESDAQAAERELAEETSLTASAIRVVGSDPDGNVFVLMGPARGTLRLGGHEADLDGPASSYDPAWVSVADLDRVNLLPVVARSLVLELAQSPAGAEETV